MRFPNDPFFAPNPAFAGAPDLPSPPRWARRAFDGPGLHFSGRGPRGHGGQGWGPGGPGGPMGPWGRRGPRARRGDVRLAVLALLDEQPMHGYQVLQELGRRSGGAWRPSPGSVYPTLQLLEDEGLVSAQEVDAKRVFSLTEAGRAVLAEARERTATPPWEALADEEGSGPGELRDAAFALGAAVMQVARTGTTAQVTRTLEILKEARKRVYALLAEDE